MRKIFYKIAIILFNLCLLLSSIITPALILASNEEYYHAQFEKNGIYSYQNENGETVYHKTRYINGDYKLKATFTDEQLDELVTHIVDYLFGDKESFYYEMDGVIINDTLTDDQPIFSEIAVIHMKDVKSLMKTAFWGAVVGWIIVAGLLILFIIKRKEVSPYLVKYTIVFYAVLLALAIIFCIWTFISVRGNINRFPSELWLNIHYLLFPFQPEKVENSSFNDTLTFILTLELFLDAVAIVIAVALSALSAWLGGILLIKKKTEKNTELLKS